MTYITFDLFLRTPQLLYSQVTALLSTTFTLSVNVLETHRIIYMLLFVFFFEML